MRLSILSMAALWGLARAHGGSEHRPVNHGLIGYGIEMYSPICAFSCGEVISSNRLACSTPWTGTVKRHNDSSWFETSAECFASNVPYLLTLARCLHVQCEVAGRAPSWDVQRFWTQHATGPNWPDQPKPAYTYDEALKEVTNYTDVHDKLSSVATLHDALDTVSEVYRYDWQLAFSTMSDSVYVEEMHSKYAIVLITCVIAIPLAVHLLRLIRLPAFWERKVVASMGHSALLGKRRAVPVPYDLGILPTRGQSAFIATVLVLNLVLLFTGYRVPDPNLWEQTPSYRFASLLANRAGILSFANLTLMMLCCGRNNIVVRFTKWSYSTMLLYHRWIAYICIFEALLHGTIHFIHHLPFMAHKLTQAYWNFGLAAVGIMCIMIPLSSLPVRKRAYELFVDSHVALSALVLLGGYYHIDWKFQHEFGYESWVYLAALLWLIDRAFRAIKLVGTGVRTAIITRIDDEYARIDIPGVKMAGHAYLYFPSLSWRPWQSHPFSVAVSVHDIIDQHAYGAVTGDLQTEFDEQPLLTAETIQLEHHEKLRRDSSSSMGSLAESTDQRESDDSTKLDASSDDSIEASKNQDTQDQAARPLATGVTFYIRRQRGITAKLFDSQQQTIKVLVEGPYRPLPIPSIATCPTLVCIAGGVGIAAILPALRSHALVGRSVLYWGCRSQGLVEAVDLEGLKRGGVEVHIKLQGRWDVDEIVSEEARSAVSRGDVIVLTSGPNSMADDVRAAVVKANLAISSSKRGRVRLVEESFSW